MTQPVKIDYASPSIQRRHSVLIMLAVSFGMAFLFAFTFVIVMTLTLPRADGAYGQRPFTDPLVFPVMAIGASLAAVLVFPFFYFACRAMPLVQSIAIIVGTTLAELMIITPINAGVGFLGSFVAFFVGLLVARRMGKSHPLE
jgi:hypothetical protein